MASEFDSLIAGVKSPDITAQEKVTPTVSQQTKAATGGVPAQSKDLDEFDLPIMQSKEAVDEFDLPIIAAKPTDAQVTRIKKEEQIPFKSLYKDPENLKIIKEYGEARFGESGKQKKSESAEDYAKRFMTAMRQVEWNTSLNGIPELNWINNAKPEEVVKASRAHNLYDKVPSFYEEGGQSGVRPIAEMALSFASDPTNILSAGIGASARYAIARQAIKNTIAARAKVVGASAGAETIIGAGQNVIDQKIKIKTGVQEEFSYGQLAIAAGLSAFGGALETGVAVARKPTKTSKKEFEDILQGKKKALEIDPDVDALNKAFDKTMDQVLNEFDIYEGRKVLDKLSEPTDLTQAQIQKDINRKAIDVARYVMILAPEYRPIQSQKISDAVKNVFMSMDNINDAVIDAALKKANLTPVEFAQATRTTVADAASIMQGYSALARTMRKIGEIDPEAQKLVDELYGKDNEFLSMTGNIMRAINRLERESKAIVVSGIGTTVRNVMGTSIGLTFDAASKIIEGTLYTTGKALTGVATGKYQKGDITKGLNDTVKDAFSTLGYLTDAGMTAEKVDLLLKDNPRLQNQLFSALQESGTQELSKVARVVNTLNVAQDVFFRRAIFAATVDKQLRRVGLDSLDILANNKTIPADVLKNAADETLKATFSYMPKPQKAADRGAEAAFEGIANKVVSIFEKFPGGSLLVTFPRFMSNAIAFQYRYSPLGALSGAGDIANGASQIARGKAGGKAQLNQGFEKLGRGAAGSVALYLAYMHRLENQDSEWYNIKNEDGSTVDIRGVFPLGPYFAAGDFAAKLKLGKTTDAKISELAQTIIGMKIPSGSQGYLIDQLPKLIAGEEGKEVDKVSKSLGRLMGDFLGRFTTPGKPVFEYLDLFNEEGQIARDPNIIGPYTTEKELKRRTEAGEISDTEKFVTSLSPFSQTAVQKVIAKIPGLKEDLPEFQPYFSDKAPVRAGEFFNSLTGVRVTPERPRIEREFVALNLDPYAFFGSTGDKVYDRAFIKESVPFVEKRLNTLLDSERYQGFTVDQKRIAVTTNMQETLGMARDITQAKMTGEDRDRVNKMRFNKLPSVARRAINELYAKENNGTTMDEAKDYKQVYKYEAIIQRYR